MTTISILDSVRADLVKNIDQVYKKSASSFFKEQIQIYGVKVPVVATITKKYLPEIKKLNKKAVFDLCEELWKSGYMEESFIACDWAYNLRKSFEPVDFVLFENWVSMYVSNWASCDSFCNHTLGSFIEMYPSYLQNLKQWTHSNNRWVRRASAVTLIIPAKNGLFLPDIFEIASSLLVDKDDLVQKGYGWLLKAASQSNQTEVFNFVMSNKKIMPRTALRYAIEKMPKELKISAMAK
jgi:3-methyladenine DNA glycosylase AlkD